MPDGTPSPERGRHGRDAACAEMWLARGCWPRSSLTAAVPLVDHSRIHLKSLPARLYRRPYQAYGNGRDGDNFSDDNCK
ncbi:hypothetical protein I552_0426 [Mycobacterium xenopi 3993]|nr:hypothetical protein I552_0426 [Mycobacterium xenopi 3993]